MSDEATPVRRAASGKTLKRGLAWVLALGAGALGLFAGYAIGVRQTQIACLAQLDANCPKLPVARPQVARGKGPDLHFYDDLAPERAVAPSPTGGNAEARAQQGNRPTPADVAKVTATAPKPDASLSPSPRVKPSGRNPSKEKTAVFKRPERASLQTGARTTQSLQFGSFPTRAEAEHLAQSLRLHDLPARVVEEAGPNKSQWFKVRVGRYPSADAANQAKTKLGAGGTTAVLVKDIDGPQ